MDGRKMPADMTLYFDVVKQIQDQINRITYANGLTEQERLKQLNRLEHEIKQKFQWARRSVDTVEHRWTGTRRSLMQSLNEPKSPAKELDKEVDLA